MTVLEKYLRGETLTHDEMMEIVPITRCGMSIYQIDSGHIEIIFKERSGAGEIITFCDEEIIKANTDDVYAPTDELPF